MWQKVSKAIWIRSLSLLKTDGDALMAEENDGQGKPKNPHREGWIKRVKAKIPRSKELNTTVVLLAGAIGLLWFGLGE